MGLLKDTWDEIRTGGSAVTSTYNKTDYRVKKENITKQAKASKEQAIALAEQEKMVQDKADEEAIQQEERDYRSKFGGRRSLLFGSRLGIQQATTLGGAA